MRKKWKRIGRKADKESAKYSEGAKKEEKNRVNCYGRHFSQFEAL